jgi:hypothetical protein
MVDDAGQAAYRSSLSRVLEPSRLWFSIVTCQATSLRRDSNFWVFDAFSLQSFLFPLLFFFNMPDSVTDAIELLKKVSTKNQVGNEISDAVDAIATTLRLLVSRFLVCDFNRVSSCLAL